MNWENRKGCWSEDVLLLQGTQRRSGANMDRQRRGDGEESILDRSSKISEWKITGREDKMADEGEDAQQKDEVDQHELQHLLKHQMKHSFHYSYIHWRYRENNDEWKLNAKEERIKPPLVKLNTEHWTQAPMRLQARHTSSKARPRDKPKKKSDCWIKIVPQEASVILQVVTNNTPWFYKMRNLV